MVRTAAFIGAAIGVIGISAASAEPIRLPATDFSAQQDPRKKVAPAMRSQPRVQPGNVNHNVNVNVNRNVNRNVNVNRNATGPTKFQKSGGSGPSGSPQLKKVGGPAQVQKFGNPSQKFGNPNQVQKSGGQGPVQKFGGAPGPGGKFKFGGGPGKIVPYQKANFPVVKVGPKFAPVWKGPKKLYWAGKWKTFVPLAALGAVAIGGAYYYADGYLTVARPYCSGVTPEGCRLNWRRVDFEEGDSDWQCVQYCRRPGAPPPARTVALVAPPPMTQGSCEMSIFSEPGFGGTNATANDEQPHLSELGWRDQIASIKVASGTWDFFDGEDFTGEVVRFGPGEYPDLGPEWSRKAGSFMCVQP